MSCVSNLSILPSSDANVSKTDFALQYTIDMDAICKRYSEKHSLREILDACGHKRNKKYIQEFKVCNYVDDYCIHGDGHYSRFDGDLKGDVFIVIFIDAIVINELLML